jgi:hypothetical protein
MLIEKKKKSLVMVDRYVIFNLYYAWWVRVTLYEKDFKFKKQLSYLHV